MFDPFLTKTENLIFTITILIYILYFIEYCNIFTDRLRFLVPFPVQSERESRRPRGPHLPATRPRRLPQQPDASPRRRSADGTARAQRVPRQQHQHANPAPGHTPVQRHLISPSTRALVPT